MDQLYILMQEFGVVVALLIVFLYWAYKKDERMERRYDELGNKLNEVQDAQRTEFLSLSKRAIAAQEHGTKIQEELIKELKCRPCLKE